MYKASIAKYEVEPGTFLLIESSMEPSSCTWHPVCSCVDRLWSEASILLWDPLIHLTYIRFQWKSATKTISITFLWILLSSQEPLLSAGEDPGVSGVSQPQEKPLTTWTVEKIAQDMVDNIIEAFIHEMETEMDHDQQTFAGDLASAVIEVALGEVCKSEEDGFHDWRSDGLKINESGRENDDSDSDAELDLDNESSHPALAQSGLPVFRSLDCPDTPPTTPFLPELQRSRHSFARKLKGGLAKEFLPSPPPSTPQDREAAGDNDPHVAFLEHLIHSLSAGEISRGCFKVDPQRGSGINTFAESLSCDIMDWVSRAKSSSQSANNSEIHLLAKQLAEDIVASSLGEAQMLL